ncbi:MAG: IS3 family transposase [Clostridiales bacterium]|nr:IS3 family transposase [Clostridiales bacterium]
MIEHFIRYYNNDRIKEKFGGLSPKQYRERMTSAQKECYVKQNRASEMLARLSPTLWGHSK